MRTAEDLLPVAAVPAEAATDTAADPELVRGFEEAGVRVLTV